MALYLPRKVIPLQSLRLSLADIKKIYGRLNGYVEEQATIEISALAKPTDKTDEQFEAQKKDIRERAFKVTVTIRGREGDELYGEDVAIFDSPNRPEKNRSHLSDQCDGVSKRFWISPSKQF
jgi:hypothetical protein